MTRLTTYQDIVELANNDTQLRVEDIMGGGVEVYIEHEADRYEIYEASSNWSIDEFKALVDILYAKYVKGVPVSHSVTELDAQ